MVSLHLGKEGLKEKRAEATFSKDRECGRGGGRDRNGRKERHEVIIRKRRDGDKVELDCLPSRGQAKGIIYKYATRELNGWGRGERRRRMQSHGGVDDASGRRVPNTMF